MKLKKKEDQTMETLILLRKANKTPMEGIIETKCGVETEEMTIQSLPHLRVYPIYSHHLPNTVVDANKCFLIGA